MPDGFEILCKDLAGRIGKLSTPHGIIETPALMPVVNPHLQLISTQELRKLGADMLITNSYIIYRDETLKSQALETGLHGLLGFEGPIMTDSGAFQLSIYGQIDISPSEILEFQSAIGSDICVPLDIPTPPDVPVDRAESDLKETEKRLEYALENKGRSLLAAPIQGSTYPHLRQSAGRFLRAKKFDLFAVGGVVPLMEAYRYSDLVEVVVASKKGLGSGAPVHLFGAGHPMVFAIAAAMGCDLFDSAAYALYARDGRYMTAYGTRRLEELRYLPCSCDVCQSHSAQELADSPEKARLLARHNLLASLREIQLVKQCIREGSLWNLLEARCRSHPRLLEGLRKLSSEAEWIEGLDSSSKSTFFYLSPQSASRPEVIRYGLRIDRLTLLGRVLITDEANWDAEKYDHVLHFKPPFGPYPPELSETYPLNAEVPVETDQAAIDAAYRNVKRLVQANPQARFSLRVKGIAQEEL